MKAISLYNNALKITSTGKTQRQMFRHWRNHYWSDDVYDTLAFDTETTGVVFGVPSILHIDNTDIKVRDVTIFGISLAKIYKNRLALVWGRMGTPLFDECINLLKSPNIPYKVAHRAQYDIRVCKHNDIALPGIINCTLTMARLHWNRRMKFDLKDLTELVCSDLYGYEDELKAVMRNIKSSHTRAGYPKGYCNYSFVPDENIREYSMIDSFICWLLNLRLLPIMKKDHKKVYRRERKIISVVIGMEERGMQFDRKRARSEIVKLDEKARKTRKKLIKLVGEDFNPNSPAQVLSALLRAGVPKKLLRKSKSKKLTTEKAMLEAAVIKVKKEKTRIFVNTLLSLRSYNKLVGTYLRPLYIRAMYNNGAVSCNINPTDTRTGRMSHSGPNLGNIPRPTSGFEKYNPVRKCFIHRAGFWNMFVDYAQMEMWLFALHAKEERMLDALRSGQDIHNAVAIQMWGDDALDKNGNVKKESRQNVKAVNFGTIFGMGFRALAKKLKKPELEAHDLRNEYYDNYPRIPEFFNECKHTLIKKGYVKDIFGRRYDIDPRQSHKAVNGVVQGGCAQILKISMISLARYLEKLRDDGITFYMVLPIHDEVIFEFNSSLPIEVITETATGISNAMTNIRELLVRDVNLKVDVSISKKSWEDKMPWDIY